MLEDYLAFCEVMVDSERPGTIRFSNGASFSGWSAILVAKAGRPGL
ncbi:MAG: hypothetical protein IPO44_02160 [Candidatus Microthrix sp.]|nr:hypothetical protein [Candidatus Microthrix sp.]MBK9558413.1 hypothetical protein [Candidatus Microthrix sp.]